MARHVRISVCGGWYHVCGRGHNREELFLGREDCAHFLELVQAMRERFLVRVYGYCLMPNHYGDWGRDLALWGGSRFGGLTLGAMGKAAGGMDYSAVNMCIKRLEARARHDRALRSAMKRVASQCS